MDDEPYRLDGDFERIRTVCDRPDGAAVPAIRPGWADAAVRADTDAALRADAWTAGARIRWNAADAAGTEPTAAAVTGLVKPRQLLARAGST